MIKKKSKLNILGSSNRNLKKGVSPVIATVLLVAIVIVIALIIFLWFKGFTQEAVVKFDTNVELVCDEVIFDAQYDGTTLYLSNDGNVPIIDFDVKQTTGGSYETFLLSELDGAFNGLFVAGTVSVLGVEGDEIVLIPILLGKTETNEEKTFVCNERYGKEVAF